MYYVKFVKYVYIAITILAIICPIKISFMNFLPGLLMMWLLFLILKKTVVRSNINLQSEVKLSVDKNCLFPIIITITYIVFYPLYVRFYTGLNIFTSIGNVLSGVSNYYLYQQYFNESNLGSFSIMKLPYIITHGLLRFSYIAITLRSLSYSDRSSLIEKICLSIMTIIIIFVGFARGTSFELFEIFLIFLFAVVTKNAINGSLYLLSKKILFKTLTFGLLFLSYFTYNITVRMGNSFDFLSNSDFDTNSCLYQISKPVAVLVYSLYDYFLFGLNYSSIIICNLWFGSIDGFLSVIIPNGISSFDIDISYRSIVSKFIDTGANWNPDMMVLSQSYGIVFLFLFVFVVGLLSTSVRKRQRDNVVSSILLFYVSYIMISLPIGNFITSSSSNLISIFCALLVFKFDFLNKCFGNYLKVYNE